MNTAEWAAVMEDAERRAEAAGRAPCPHCGKRVGTTQLGGGAVWCRSCDDPATG